MIPTCNLCGGRKFLPEGRPLSRALAALSPVAIGRRSAATCAGCGSKERARLAMALLDAEQEDYYRVYHIAPEPGLARPLRDLARDYRAFDPAPERFSWSAKQGIQIESYTLAALPQGGATIIIAMHVLEHVQDLQAGVAGIVAALAPGGLALVPVPRFDGLPDLLEIPGLPPDPDVRQHFYGQSDHARAFGRNPAKAIQACISPDIAQVFTWTAPEAVRQRLSLGKDFRMMFIRKNSL